MTNTKGGHTPNATVPEAKASDITIGTRIESVPDMLDEQSMEQAFRAYQRMVREVGKDIGKQWLGMPEKYKPPHYVYYRCGVRGDPQAEYLRSEMCKQGWQDAPRGSYCTLYMTDRGQGVYVCTSASVYKQYHAFENQLIWEKNERALRQKKKQTVEALRDQGIEIEGENERHETMTAEEFMGGRDVHRRETTNRPGR